MITYLRAFCLSAIFGLVLTLAACAAAESTTSGPGQAVEAYLQALVNQDVNQIANLSCADWEASARDEVESFQAVSASLEGVACTQASLNGADAVVTCTGQINASYGNEQQAIPLNVRNYVARQEGGEWRMCGYLAAP